MATQFKIERIRRDLSQMDVAAAVFFRVSQSRISAIERGLIPSLQEAKLLAEALGMQPRDLWPGLEATVES